MREAYANRLFTEYFWQIFYNFQWNARARLATYHASTNGVVVAFVNDDEGTG